MDYTNAQTALDKLRREAQILDLMGPLNGDHRHVEIMVAQAKRVRTASNLAVREFARIRDQLQP